MQPRATEATCSMDCGCIRHCPNSDFGPGASVQSTEFFMWRAGRVFGNSPQEVAVFMAARVAAAHRPRLGRAVIKMWIQKRKIDPAADHFHAALTALDV